MFFAGDEEKWVKNRLSTPPNRYTAGLDTVDAGGYVPVVFVEWRAAVIMTVGGVAAVFLVTVLGKYDGPNYGS